MATPLVAASATLVRQYFLDGFYPSGAATAANAYAPSGALVKVIQLVLLLFLSAVFQFEQDCSLMTVLGA